MADKKISQLTAASTPLAGTEVLPIVQSNATVKVAVSNLTAGRDVNASSFQVGTRLKMFSTYIADAASPTGNNTGLAFSNRIYPCDSAGTLTNNTLALGSGSYQFSTIYTGDNVVVGTAAKGVNFTANTPAAGMTSQLLNWYEEGTWTPVVSGTWTTTPTIFGTARYTRVGRQVTLTFAFLNGALALNTNGYFTGLPFTPADVGTGAVVDNNIVNRGLCEATGAGRIWVTNTLFPDVNYISITYFV